MNKTEEDFVFKLASKLVNKIPYGKNKDHIYICPADVLQQSDRMISVTRTASKMGDLNAMMGVWQKKQKPYQK